MLVRNHWTEASEGIVLFLNYVYPFLRKYRLCQLLTCNLGVKVAQVGLAFDCGNEGRLDLFVHQFVDVKIFEERMKKNVINVVILTKSHLSVFSKHFGDQILCLRGDFDVMPLLDGPTDRRVLNEVVHLMLVLVVEWRNADDHLVDEDAESPPVQRLVVA